MTNADNEGELETLAAIYCHPGEFTKISENFIVIEFSPGNQICIELGNGYPETPPILSLRCSSLKKQDSQEILTQLQEEAQKLQGNPCVLELCQLARDLFDTSQPQNNHREDASTKFETSSEPVQILILALDHMRDKKKYIQHLRNMTAQLNITGRLLLCGKIIRCILAGRKEAVKEFLRLLRTVCVDVDSEGKQCKERKLSILHEEIMPNFELFTDFDVVMLQSMQELRTKVKEFGFSESDFEIKN